MKNQTFILTFLLISFTVGAQQWQWVKKHGNGSIDQPYNVGIDKDDNLYVMGIDYFQTHNSSTSNYTNRMFYKFNKDGEIIWKQTLPYIYYHSITDNQGNTYLLSGNRIIKFDPNGTELWLKYESDGIYRSIAFHPSGDFIVTGELKNSTKSIIARYDLNGNKKWLITTDFVLRDSYPNQITCASDGYIYYAGGGANDINDKNAKLAKFDANGNLLFSKDIPSYCKQLITDNKNNIYVACHSSVQKYDQDGNILWSENIVSNELLRITSLQVTANNELILLGHYNKSISIANETLTSDYSQLFVVRFSETGNVSWITETRGEQGNSFPYAMRLNKGGEIIIAAAQASDKQYGSITMKVEGMYSDIILAKIGMDHNTVGISQHTKQLNDNMIVYPNPSGSIFNLLYKPQTASGKIFLSVKNILGATVYSETLMDCPVSVSKQIDLTHLAKGTYFVTTDCNGVINTKKIILQ